jgi:hypothetical protein
VATFEFKCRRCGEIELNPHCGDRFALGHLINAVHGFKKEHAQAPDMVGIHNCKNGGTGVCDLIGYVEDNPSGKKDNSESPENDSTTNEGQNG